MPSRISSPSSRRGANRQSRWFSASRAAALASKRVDCWYVAESIIRRWSRFRDQAVGGLEELGGGTTRDPSPLVVVLPCSPPPLTKFEASQSSSSGCDGRSPL